MWSNLSLFFLTNSNSNLTRSPRTVQQRQPLFTITISSFAEEWLATNDPSISTSPNYIQSNSFAKTNFRMFTNPNSPKINYIVSAKPIYYYPTFNYTTIRIFSYIRNWLSSKKLQPETYYTNEDSEIQWKHREKRKSAIEQAHTYKW